MLRCGEFWPHWFRRGCGVGTTACGLGGVSTKEFCFEGTFAPVVVGGVIVSRLYHVTLPTVSVVEVGSMLLFKRSL